MFPTKFSTLRTLAKISDKLISRKLVFQDVTQLKAKYLHKATKKSIDTGLTNKSKLSQQCN